MPVILPVTYESLVFNGAELNDDVTYWMQEFDCPPPPKRQEWIKGVDSDSSQLLRRPYVDNRTVTIKLRQVQQANKNACLAAIGTIIDSIQEAELKADSASPVTLVWSPSGGTKSFTFHVLSGEITDIPIVNGTSNEDNIGWLYNFPVITIRLDCEGPAYGDWVTSAATVTNSTPIQTVTIPSIPGDLPAEVIIRITDAATQSRRHAEVAVQSRYYDVAAGLEIDSASLVTSGFAGSSTTLAGSYNTNVITAALWSQTQAVCGTGNLGHVGTFRVKARANLASTATQVRLSYQDGDGPFKANDWVTAPFAGGGWTELDLGTITINEAEIGSQKWSGRIESYTTNASTGGPVTSESIYVDYLLLIPTDAYGKARASYSYSAGVLTARDEFSSIAAGTALNTRTAPTGGTWATSGATTDLVAADAPTGTEETETRATTADAAGGRFAILGATSFTASETEVAVYRTANVASTTTFYQGAIARWTDASNHLRVTLSGQSGPGAALAVSKVVTGTPTTLATLSTSVSVGTWYRIRVVVFASGAGTAYLLDASGATLGSVAFQDAVLATGGTLATGKPGFVDYNGSATATTRYYDNFSHSTPAAEPIVVYSGRVAHFRYDGAVRQDSTGTYYGDVPAYRGAKFFLGQAGSANRTVRVLGKSRRNDIDAAADDHVTDSTTLTVDYRPRYYAIPR